GKIRAAAGVVFLHDVPVVGKVHVAGKGQRHAAVLRRLNTVPVGGQRRGGRRGRRRRGGGHCGRGGGHRRRAAARRRRAPCQQQRRAQCRRQGGFSFPHGAASFLLLVVPSPYHSRGRNASRGSSLDPERGLCA